jgi:predicted DNA-binding protein (UPF0251 family)
MEGGEMARQRCCGLVEEEPYCRRFTADDGGDTDLIVLQVEELEAVRLKDLTGMDQSASAASMGLSRATFQRILQSARGKIALALVTGQTIMIQGGSYMVKNRKFQCQDCNHIWEVAPCSEGGKHGYEIECPQCGSMKKIKIAEDGQKHVCGGGHGHHHGGGCCGH